MNWQGACIHPQYQNLQNRGVTGVTGVTNRANLMLAWGLPRSVSVTPKKYAGVTGVTNPLKPESVTPVTPCHTSVFCRCDSSPAPRKPNEYAGLAQSVTPVTPVTPQKHQSLKSLFAWSVKNDAN